MREQSAPPDVLIARIAANQHGVVTYEQLRRAGLSGAAINRRVAAGRLHRIHRGVYAVGHAGLSRRGEWKAATLALAPVAFLSHRSAAELWGMLRGTRSVIHITVASRSGRCSRDGIHIHRPRSLPPPARLIRDGIPITSPARTIADLRRSESAATVRRAIREAELARLPLGDIRSDGTRSDLERAFLRLCRRYRIPEPMVNAPLGRYTVDFLWPRERLVVEVDSYLFHSGRQAFRDDRDRDVDLALRGITVLRFADTRIDDDARGVASAILEFLRERR
jgi:very-short-patch-repair endonuclease